jgi:transposase-like protein
MTKPRKGGLTDKQHLVINLLATGHSMSDAAAIAGISRSAILNWHSSIPLFRETLRETRVAVGWEARVKDR